MPVAAMAVCTRSFKCRVSIIFLPWQEKGLPDYRERKLQALPFCRAYLPVTKFVAGAWRGCRTEKRCARFLDSGGWLRAGRKEKRGAQIRLVIVALFQSVRPAI